MNIPGFTAEAALCRTSTHYHMRVAATQANGAVQPALWFCFPVCFPIRGVTVCLNQWQCNWIPDPIPIPRLPPIPQPDPREMAVG
jgi:hypothetical protein